MAEDKTGKASHDCVVTVPEQVFCFVHPPQGTEERKYNSGYVLQAKGKIVEFEKSMQGSCLDDWLIEDLTPEGFEGLLVWEGRCLNGELCHPEWEPQLLGEWRQPNALELWRLRQGQQAL